MTSSLSSALSSMEEMLDALMQRGIGKPEERTREEAPPALPSRPTVRGRPPSSSQRPGAPAPWVHRAPLPALPPPQEERRQQCSFNLEMEKRAVKAEEDSRQKDDDVRQKEEEIGVLRQQVENYEQRLSEFEIKMKSVEEELQKQITALQIAQNTRSMRSGSASSSLRHRRELSPSSVMAAPSMAVRAEESSSDHQQRSCEPMITCERETELMAEEVHRQSGELDLEAEEESSEKENSMDELQMLKRQFSVWKKEYEAELGETKAELKKRVHDQEQQQQTSRRRCSWWRKKAAKCKPSRCCAASLHCPMSSCCHCPTSSSCWHCPTTCWQCPTISCWRCPTACWRCPTTCSCHWPTSCCHWPTSCSFSKCFRRCC